MMKKYLLAVCVTLCLLAGCSDEKLAREADGVWTTTLNLKDEYGTPYKEKQTYAFTYVKSDEKDGGTFVERIEAIRMEEDKGLKVTYKVLASINGEWEVIFGDLYQHYHIQTLEVVVTDVGGFGLGTILEDAMVKELRKNVYKNIREGYEAANHCCFLELSIKNNCMEFITDDIGRVKLEKIN